MVSLPYGSDYVFADSMALKMPCYRFDKRIDLEADQKVLLRKMVKCSGDVDADVAKDCCPVQ